ATSPGHWSRHVFSIYSLIQSTRRRHDLASPFRRCTIPQQPATPKRKRVTGADRRRLILSGARDAFLASGYAGARTKDIAERAGITEAVIYRHFASKEELFEEAILSPL